MNEHEEEYEHAAVEYVDENENADEQTVVVFVRVLDRAVLVTVLVLVHVRGPACSGLFALPSGL